MAKSSIACLFLAALTAGCSTVAVVPNAAMDVPAERLVRPSQTGDARLTVVRDEGFLGKACYYALYVNRELTARMATSERVSLAVPSGEVLLGVGRDPQGAGLCSPVADTTRVQRETLLKPGEHKFYRLVIQRDGGVDLMRSDF